MQDGIVIKEYISEEEVKQILGKAMNAFCKAPSQQEKAEKEKAMYIAGRHNYWLSQGFAHEDALQKANEDYEWIN
jgi:predicted lipoprotein